MCSICTEIWVMVDGVLEPVRLCTQALFGCRWKALRKSNKKSQRLERSDAGSSLVGEVSSPATHSVVLLPLHCTAPLSVIPWQLSCHAQLAFDPKKCFPGPDA